MILFSWKLDQWGSYSIAPKGDLKRQTIPYVYYLNLLPTMIKVRYKHTDPQIEY
jgi:hypothetical protein